MRSLTGSQCRSIRIGVMWSCFRIPVIRRAAANIYIERNTEKLNLARIVLKRLQTPWKQTNAYNNAITQCHVDGNQRAWATCGFSSARPDIESRNLWCLYAKYCCHINTRKMLRIFCEILSFDYIWLYQSVGFEGKKIVSTSPTYASLYLFERSMKRLFPGIFYSSR